MPRTERLALATLLLALFTAPAAAQNPVAAADTAAARAQAIADSAAARALRMQAQMQAQQQQQTDSVALAMQEPAAPEHMPLEPPRPMPDAPINADEVKLVFDREVYRYEAAGRRDPFKPLTDGKSGPLFADLTLRMIVYSSVPGQSIAVLADQSKTVYRLRRGESVGNITVVDITAERVTFSVEDFGVSRREVLSIKPDNETEGA